MLEHSEILRLIREAQNGSESAKSTLLEHNYPLIKSVIKNYINKGVEYDDLYQLGCVGFLKAINNFDEKFEVKFSTYCVPMVAGEVKRYMRDNGSIKVSRSLRGLNYKINKFINEHKAQNNGDTPTIEAISKELGQDEHDIVLAMESGRSLISLDEKIDDDENSASLIDRVPCNAEQFEKIDFIVLKEALCKLDKKERKIILLRYFRNRTQSEVAIDLGVSQVQVSRMENKIIQKIRKEF